jgi:prepilin-type processing-associated H-X9-DG protein/prepilin-type N-terminal cleavage/methylation domain-containing protein
MPCRPRPRLRPRRPAPVRAAFTLVELLVVIGIIALLIAILMPALSAAKRQAQTLRCAANLSDIGRAMQQYANDYRGRIPRGYDYFGVYQSGHILWAEAISRYLNHPVEVRDLSNARDAVMAREFAQIGVYQCPVFPNERQVLDYVSNSWDGGTGGGTDGAAIIVTRVRRSSEIVFLTEANARADVNYFNLHDVWAPEHLPAGGAPRVLNDQRHGGRINLLLLDGHVNTKTFKEVRRSDFDFLYVGPR